MLPIRFLRFLAVAFVLLANTAAASEIETERMTWVEIRDAVAAGSTSLIIPTGGTEQNGPHMVTGKHNFIVKATARRIAEKLGKTLVAPVMAYVPEGDIATREGHMAYPGSISVPENVYAGVLEAAAKSFAIHGFKLIVFLGDSGPNQAPQQAVAADLSRRWAADGVRVINADAYYADNGQQEWLKSEGETDAAIGVHASIRDTSELMAIAPDGIRQGLRAADKDGVSGDPTRATASRGEKLIGLKVATAVKEIEKARNSLPDVGDTSASAEQQGLWTRFWRWFFG